MKTVQIDANCVAKSVGRSIKTRRVAGAHRPVRVQAVANVEQSTRPQERVKVRISTFSPCSLKSIIVYVYASES